MTSPSPEVLLTEQGALGRITLNRPKALNSLTLGMIREMTRALQQWRTDDRIGAVLIEGAGERGLCAGGDIRAVHDAVKAGDVALSDSFWAGPEAVRQRHVTGLDRVVHGPDVPAGAESALARALDEHRADAVVGAPLLQGAGHLADHAQRQGVERLRAVERDPAERALLGEQDLGRRRCHGVDSSNPREMISRMISFVPSRIWCTRRSRTIFSLSLIHI